MPLDKLDIVEYFKLFSSQNNFRLSIIIVKSYGLVNLYFFDIYFQLTDN